MDVHSWDHNVCVRMAIPRWFRMMMGQISVMSWHLRHFLFHGSYVSDVQSSTDVITDLTQVCVLALKRMGWRDNITSGILY